jgi:hypothetical protein
MLWFEIMQGSDKELLQVRSPLRETSIDNDYPMPKSPLSFNSPTYKSSNILPPLKFHSGLLPSHNLEINSFNDCEDDYDFDEYDGHDDHESVGSASDDMDCTYSEEEELNEVMLNDNPVNVSGPVGLNKSTLNRGTIKEDLCVEVPQKTRKFTETGWHGGASTMPSSVSAASRLRDMLQPHSAYVSLIFLMSFVLVFYVYKRVALNNLEKVNIVKVTETSSYLLVFP